MAFVLLGVLGAVMVYVERTYSSAAYQVYDRCIHRRHYEYNVTHHVVCALKSESHADMNMNQHAARLLDTSKCNA